MLLDRVKLFAYAIRALTAHDIDEAEAMRYLTTIPSGNAGEAAVASFADLGWIFQSVLDEICFDDSEAVALSHLLDHTCARGPGEASELLLILPHLDGELQEEVGDGTDPALLARLTAKMAALPPIHRLVIYRMWEQAQYVAGQSNPSLLEAMKKVGLVR